MSRDTGPANEQKRQAPQPVGSMTGYGHRSADLAGGKLIVEIRSVNSRFTDFTLKLHDEWRAIESPLRERLHQAVRRGKLECRVQWHPRGGQDTSMQLDRDEVARLLSLQQQVLAVDASARPLSVGEILAWPGVLAQLMQAADDPDADADAADEDPASAAWSRARPVIEAALADFEEMRRREGARLASSMKTILEEMRAIVLELRPAVPEMLAHAEQKLVRRLSEALAQVTAGEGAAAMHALPADEIAARVRHEVSLLGIRADVVEEMDRLDSHVSEMTRTLDEGGPIGKRLDFISQEMNREANTIGSKAAGLSVSQASVNLKLLVEQLREQAQNIE